MTIHPFTGMHGREARRVVAQVLVDGDDNVIIIYLLQIMMKKTWNSSLRLFSAVSVTLLAATTVMIE